MTSVFVCQVCGWKDIDAERKNSALEKIGETIDALKQEVLCEFRQMRYIAKDGGWFDTGTEAILIDDYGFGSGLFRGTKNGQPDEEVCAMDEFEVENCKAAK